MVTFAYHRGCREWHGCSGRRSVSLGRNQATQANSSVHMSVNQPMTISDQAADSLLPHITWFLIYLTEGGPMRAQQESPWVTFYAFKVCLIVLQLLRYGSRAAYYDGLAKIGIVDDATMVDWIEEVFRLRRRWGVGESVLRCVRAIWCI